MHFPDILVFKSLNSFGRVTLEVVAVVQLWLD